MGLRLNWIIALCMAFFVQSSGADNSKPNSVHESPPAFPGAEGYGRYSAGGRGGKVIKVTNLNDSGKGSLRAALLSEGKRTVVFNLGGTIELETPIRIRNPYLTIAGQTAPGDGICVKGREGHLTGNAIIIDTHDVIIRHLRVRAGSNGKKWINSIHLRSGHDIILDHLSASWGPKGVIGTWGDVKRVTIQNSIISEGLDVPIAKRPKPHSRGALVGGGATTFTFYRNLFAHNRQRNPWVKVHDKETGSKRAEFQIINNVIYNWKNGGLMIGSAKRSAGQTFATVVANYFKAGPETREPSKHTEVSVFGNGENTTIFLQGNIGPNRSSDSLPEWTIVGKTRPKNGGNSKFFDAPPLPTLGAQDTYRHVLKQAGATVPKRDTVDERIVKEVELGEGGLIRDPAEVGGWPLLESGAPPADSDEDGMPDNWEIGRGLDPRNSEDRNGDPDSNGYTNLEEYLNEKAGPI